MKAPAANQRVSVSRIPGDGCKIRFTIGFDPKAVGPEATERIYAAVSGLIRELLTEAEQKLFLEKLERARLRAVKRREAAS